MNFIKNNFYHLKYVDHAERTNDAQEPLDETIVVISHPCKFKGSFIDKFNLEHCIFILEQTQKGKEVLDHEIDVLRVLIVDSSDLKFDLKE